MDAEVGALIAAVNKQSDETDKRAYLFSVLMELSTSFPGALFADSVEAMKRYWDQQGVVNGFGPIRDLEYCAELLEHCLKAEAIDINGIGDMMNEKLLPAVSPSKFETREAMADFFKTLAVYNSDDFKGATQDAIEYVETLNSEME